MQQLRAVAGGGPVLRAVFWLAFCRRPDQLCLRSVLCGAGALGWGPGSGAEEAQNRGQEFPLQSRCFIISFLLK